MTHRVPGMLLSTRVRPSRTLSVVLAVLFIAPAPAVPATASPLVPIPAPWKIDTAPAPARPMLSTGAGLSAAMADEPVTDAASAAEQDASLLTGLCGLGGACVPGTGGSLSSFLAIPDGSMVLSSSQPWDRVVKQSAAAAWQPLEFEARQTLAALHGVANDKRLPHFAAEDIRAHLLRRLVGFAQRESNGDTLTQVEQTALAKFRDLVFAEKTAAARFAVEEYNKWAGSPCTYQVPQYPDPLPPDPWQLPGTPAPAMTPLGFAPYTPGAVCQEGRYGSLVGGPRPPTLEQFVAYGAGRAAGAYANADAQAAIERMGPAVAFAIGVSAAVVAGAISTLLAIAIPALAVGLAAAMGSTLAASFLAGVGGAAIGSFGATTAATAATVGVGVAGGPVAVILIAVVVTVIGTVNAVEDASILPQLQQRLNEASSAVDINAMANDADDAQVLFLTIMKQTFPDYGDRRMSTPSVAVPQARPTGAPRFLVNGELRDSIITYPEEFGAYQQTFMADGWFVTRTSTDLTNWTPWRWALTIAYRTDGGLRIFGIQPNGFLDVPYLPGEAATAAVVRAATVRPYVFDTASGPATVVWAGNRPPVLEPRSTDPDIVAGESIQFVANASDPGIGGGIAAIRWFIEDRAWPTGINPRNFAACGFGPPPVDPASGLLTVCPWKPYDDSGAGVTAVFATGGVFSVRVMAMDNEGATTTQEFSVNVAQSVPTLSATISSTSITEGQAVDVSGSVLYPRLPTGYAAITRLSVDWGDGTSTLRDYPCSIQLGGGCTFDGAGIITSGPTGPWPFVASNTLAFRPDRTVRPTTPIVVSAITDKGVAAPPLRFAVNITNVRPTVYPFDHCVSSGLLICNPATTDSRSQQLGRPLVLRAYINDVPAGAHSITTFWGDGTSTVLQPGCGNAGCPELVAEGPAIPLFLSQYPWKKFERSHTYPVPGAYVVRTLVNDGGPNGLVTLETPVTISGIGELQGPQTFSGGTTQVFTLDKLLNGGDTLLANGSCGSAGTVSTAFDGRSFACTFPEVTADTSTSVALTGQLNGIALSRSLSVTVTRTALTLSNLSGPTSLVQGGVATWTYSYAGPGAGIATTTITPGCPGTLLEQVSGVSFKCRITDTIGPATAGVSIETSLAQHASRTLNVSVIADTTPPQIGVPAPITVDSTSNAGAIVSFLTSVSDAIESLGDITVGCTPEAGSLFPIRLTTVSCFARDRFGNTDTKTFTVTVLDRTPPSLTVSGQVSAEATGPTGAAVSYQAPAAVDAAGPVAAGCSPASGAVFPLGTTTVGCTAVDSAGNRGSASFTVTVVDSTAPSLTIPTPVTLDSTSNAGRMVTYAASATDLVSGTVAVSCSVPSESVFPIGQTTVTCTAKDAAGNTASRSFPVTIVDVSAPTLAIPTVLSVDATSSSGAMVTFAANATDYAPAAPLVSCTPQSGTTFAIGVTTVRCSAEDAVGNRASGQFSVTVTSAAAQISALLARIEAMTINDGVKKNLLSIARTAAKSMSAGRLNTCSHLAALAAAARARGSGLTDEDAALIILEANRIRAVLGC
jgi:HYR domain-containing protein